MLVVTDATPLHYLILINEIDLLRKLYGRVVVPAAVLGELSASRTPPEVRAWIAVLPSWITAAPAFDPDSLPFASLGLGEREAIALAQGSAGSLLLTDDLQARGVAERIGIQTVPTIRVLSTAGDLALIDFNDAITRLQQTNFRISWKILDPLLKRHSTD